MITNFAVTQNLLLIKTLIKTLFQRAKSLCGTLSTPLTKSHVILECPPKATEFGSKYDKILFYQGRVTLKEFFWEEGSL